MKKMISLLLTAVLLLTAFSACSKAKNNDVVDNIVYEVCNAYWQGNKLAVEGCIVNLNRENDIVSLENTELVVTDSNGRELGTIKLNQKFQEACKLRPMSKLPYSFTLSKLTYDKSKYTSLSKGLQVDIGAITCRYGTCSGENCENCNYNGFDLQKNPFEYKAGNNDPGSKVQWSCTLCNETGKCFVCGGDGVDETMKGSIWGTTCTLCNGTGICVACGGDGIRS